MVHARAFKPLSLCLVPLKTYWQGFLELSEWKKATFLAKYVLWKCCGVYQKLWMLEHFAIVLRTLEILMVGISGAFRIKESHFLSKNLFWENAVGFSEIVNVRALFHCVQNPWKLTDRDFWSSRNKRKPLSKQKSVLRKCWRSKKMVHARAFKALPLCSSPLKTS